MDFIRIFCLLHQSQVDFALPIHEFIHLVKKKWWVDILIYISSVICKEFQRGYWPVSQFFKVLIIKVLKCISIKKIETIILATK